MARKDSNLFSVSEGRLADFIPIRVHDVGFRDKESGVWTLVDKIIVSMLSDVLHVPIWSGGVKTGDYRKVFVKPMRYIPCAGGSDSPRMSPDGTKAFSGTYVNAEVDGKMMTVLMARDASKSTECWVHVREGWKPDRSGKYGPSIIGDIKKGNGKRFGRPGSFLLGASKALQSESTEVADEETGGRVSSSGKSDWNVDGQVVHFAVYSLCNGESIIGQTKYGQMWLLKNEGGVVVQASDEEAEAMRPIYDFKEGERKKQAVQNRVARLKKERDDRLQRQQSESAAPVLEVADDQVVVAPAADEVAEEGASA